MVMPTWEIVCLTLTVISIAAVSAFIFIRCWKSIKASSKKDPRPARRPAVHNVNMDITEVYGVPYPSPTPRMPARLDPAKLEAMVMNGKSDIHPKYLERNDYVGDVTRNSQNETLDHKVTWSSDSILMESEFQPSMSESPIIDVHRGSGVVLDDSPTVKKVLHICYDKGVDGAPDIKNMSTDLVTSDPLEDIANDIKNGDVIKNSTPKISRGVNFRQIEEDANDSDVTQLDHVTLSSSHERTLLKAPGGRWVSFDEDTPTVLIQDEDGVIRHTFEFDA